MARIHSFLPHILLLMSVYTATMMNAAPLILDIKTYDYSSSDVIEILYPDNEVNRDPVVIETLYPDNEVNATLFGYLYIMSDEKPVSGSIYIRWGRDVCPNTAHTVYSGLAAAPDRLVSGGGSNYLCMPDPFYNISNTQPEKRRKRSYIYTVKYRDDFQRFFRLVGHDVPCAVCESIGRNTMLMIPDVTHCPSSEWNLEYNGFLMAERETHYRVQYVCLDGHPTARNDPDQRETGNGNSTTINDLGQREKFGSIHPVEGGCPSNGDWQCGIALRCTVCTK